jgi:ankyrin repeat protein
MKDGVPSWQFSSSQEQLYSLAEHLTHTSHNFCEVLLSISSPVECTQLQFLRLTVFFLSTRLQKHRSTALIMASFNGHSAVISLLLKAGADKNSKNVVSCSCYLVVSHPLASKIAKMGRTFVIWHIMHFASVPFTLVPFSV